MGFAALARLPPSRDASRDTIIDSVFSELLDKTIGSDYDLNTSLCTIISFDFIAAGAGDTRTSLKEG